MSNSKPRVAVIHVMGAVLILLAAACGDDGGSQPDAGTPTPDAIIGDGVAPAVTIVFPPPRAWTGQDQLTVRGTATDADGISAIRVNGVSATSSDGFATWEAEIPLESYGLNTIVVASEDVAGTSEPRAAEQTVDHSPLMVSPVGVVVDQPRGRALVADAQLRAVLAIDLVTGTRSVMSGKGVGTGPDIEQPGPIVLDEAQSRVLAVDRTRQALLAIDITSGARTILSDPETGTGPLFTLVKGLALDAGKARALLVDDALGALLAVDLATGNRTVLSSGTVGTGPAFSSTDGVALDTARDRALVLQRGNGITLLSVDLATGDRAVLSDDETGAGPNPFFAQAITVDAPGNRALVSGLGANDSGDSFDALFAVDLVTGDRSILSGGDIGAGPTFDLPNALVLDAAANRSLVTNTSQLDALMAVDLGTGNRAIVSETRLGAGPRIDRPDDMALDLAGERVIALQGGGSLTKGPPALFEIQLATGTRTILSGGGVGIGPDLKEPRSMALVPGQARAFVIDNELQALLSVDLETGERTIVSSADLGAGPVVTAGGALVFDAAGNRLLTLDTSRAAVVAMEPANGTPTDISDADTGTGEMLTDPNDIILDGKRNRVLVIEGGTEGRVIEVDLDSGDRRVLSGPGVGTGPAFSFASSGALDEGRERLFVIADNLIEIDLRNGNRVAHVDVLDGLGIPSTAMVFDPANGYAWGVSTTFTLMVMDPSTDEVLLVSH